MRITTYILFSLSIFIGLFTFSSAKAEVITLQKAEILAGRNDPAIEQRLSKAMSFEEQAISEKQWNNPKVKFALQNFPVDGFSYTREGMTQVVAGISQDLPRGKILSYKNRKKTLMSNVEYAALQEYKNQVLLSVRQSWFDLYYWHQAKKNIDSSERLLKKVITATEDAYSTGRRNTQDLIRAELELSVLQDKKIDVKRQMQIAQEKLGKWIGISVAKQDFPTNIPDIIDVASVNEIKNNLAKHSRITAINSMINVAEADVKIAQEQYKPAVNLGLNYGFRNGSLQNGASRPDFVSGMVTIDFPLFNKTKQDKNLSARKHDTASVNHKREDVMRDLQTMLNVEYKNWKRHKDRINHYESQVLKLSKENFDASLRAYQDDLTDFSSLIRAQLIELETKLLYMKLKTEHAKIKAKLLYLMGI